MKLNLRVKKIRELRGHKQSVVASMMGVTQQGYSAIESHADSAKLETLKRFASALRVDISFLISDVPITEETLEQYGSRPYSIIVSEHRIASKKVIFFEDLFSKK